MTRRKQGGFELIASAPWPFGVVLGIIAYVGVRYGISWYLSSSGNQFLVPLGKAADGGIDLCLSKDGKTTLVQCKQWRSQRVDVKVVREMYGLLAHHGADAIKIVAIGDFTADAKRFAQDKPIELVHGEALLTMIRDVQNSASVEAVAAPRPATTRSIIPDCPSCGAPMVKRTNRRSHEAFWGCPKYPNCRGTRPA